jgi:hypothetical protein
MARDQDDNMEYGESLATMTFYEEAPPPPPPPGLTSPFDSIHEWLHHLCNTCHPEKFISEYHFCLVERPSNPLLALEGMNEYTIGPAVFERRIDYKPPTHMYFALPADEFENLDGEQLRQRVQKQLIDFTRSSTFLQSFLAKGDSVSIGFLGIIWSRDQDGYPTGE